MRCGALCFSCDGRSCATQQAKTNETRHNYARNQKTVIADHQQRFVTQSQLRFDKQNQELANPEVSLVEELMRLLDPGCGLGFALNTFV